MNIQKISNFACVNENDSINTIINKMNESPHKIIFVLKNNRLIGTITDGDIRRYLYNEKKDFSKAKAYNLMNTNFKYLFIEELKNNSTKDYLIYNVEYLPVLNKKNEIIKVLKIPINFQELSKLKTKVLIMAGGKGTRLYPLTKVIPKPLVPYKDKTIIEQIMEQFINSGFDDFILSVNYKKEFIKDYFSESKYKIRYIEEKDFLGTVGSVAYLRFYNVERPFFVANCDVLLPVDFKEILEYHKSEQADITIIASKIMINLAYGVLEFDNNNSFKSIEEKPNYSFYVNTGIYILNPDIINIIKIEEKLDMPELLKRAKSIGATIKVYKSEREMIDIGRWEYYKKIL